jgi:hypothetical protein
MEIKSRGPGIVCALKVVAHGRAELPQHECHKWSAAIHRTQREEHHGLQPSDAPESQMHLAPLRVHTRGHIVLADVTSHEELDRHDPEQASEGRDEGQQIKEEAVGDERPEAGGRENRSEFDQVEKAEERHHERGI